MRRPVVDGFLIYGTAVRPWPHRALRRCPRAPPSSSARARPAPRPAQLPWSPARLSPAVRVLLGPSSLRSPSMAPCPWPARQARTCPCSPVLRPRLAAALEASSYSSPLLSLCKRLETFYDSGIEDTLSWDGEIWMFTTDSLL